MKYLTFLAIFVFYLGIFTSPVQAIDSNSITVQGRVTLINGNPWTNGPITVKCAPDNNSTNKIGKSTHTNNQGFYSVVFSPNECAVGNDYFLFYGDSLYCRSRTDCDYGGRGVDQNVVTEDFILPVEPSTIEVPEFGAISGLIAVAGSLIGYFKLRKA